MPGVLTHTAILLMARDRVREIRDVLRLKEATGHALTDFEKRVKQLSEKTYEFMSVPPHPAPGGLPVRAFAMPLGEDVATFAVLGSMGPALPAFSSLLTPYQDWVLQTMHKGNADPNRELVVARTTDFILEFWQQVQAALAAAPLSVAEREAERLRMRALVLGYVSHIAADVVAAPYFDAVAWHATPKSTARFAEDGRSALAPAAHLDAQVARQVLLRGSTREGQRWSAWWPPADDLKDYFFAAYHATLERIYTTGSTPPVGFGDFEDRYRDYARPTESAAFLKSGYATYRDWILPLAYDHGFWGYWFWVTGLLAVPLLAAPFFEAYLLKQGRKRLIPSNPDHDAEQPWYELLTLPLALTSWVPLALGFLILNPLTLREGGAYFWASSSVSLVSTVLGGVSLGYAIDGTSLNPWVRWVLLFGLPVVAGITHAVFLIRDSAVNERRVHRLLPLIFLTPLLLSAAFLILYFIIYWLFGEEIIRAPDLTAAGPFWLAFLPWFILATTLWVVVGFQLRDYVVPENPGEFPAKDPQLVRLFDEATLYRLPAHNERLYPSGRRKLLKLWWEGTDPLFIRSDRDQLVFSFAADGSAPQVVPAPIAPMTAQEYGAFLTRSATDRGGTHTNQLKWMLADPRDRDIDYELPPGAVFADHGDQDDTTLSQHDDKAKTFVKLASSADDSDYFLYHAPKPYQATRWGRRGPVAVDGTRSADTANPAGMSVGVAGGSLSVVTGNAASNFLSFFRSGDVIMIGAEKRTVLAVLDDHTLTTVLPFSAAIPAGTAYTRMAQERVADVKGDGTIASPLDREGDPLVEYVVNGTGTHFGEFLKPGDSIRALFGSVRQIRTVHTVISDVVLTVDTPFDPAVPSGTEFERVGLEHEEGYRFVPHSPDEESLDESVMDYAADLAALLCLGATPHLMTAAERDAAGRVRPGPATPLAPVYQVFRNWNLDRRRVNEWRMLVAGGAVSEKHGAPAGRDEAMADVPGYASPTPAGEGVASRYGWVPVLRKWLEMEARFTDVVTAPRARRPDDPTNHQLTQAMGFLLELAAPAATP